MTKDTKSDRRKFFGLLGAGALGGFVLPKVKLPSTGLFNSSNEAGEKKLTVQIHPDAVKREKKGGLNGR